MQTLQKLSYGRSYLFLREDNNCDEQLLIIFVKLRCLEYDETFSNGCLEFTPSNSVVVGTHGWTLPQLSYETETYNTTMSSCSTQTLLVSLCYSEGTRKKHFKTIDNLNYNNFLKVREGGVVFKLRLLNASVFLGPPHTLQQ